MNIQLGGALADLLLLLRVLGLNIQSVEPLADFFTLRVLGLNIHVGAARADLFLVRVWGRRIGYGGAID